MKDYPKIPLGIWPTPLYKMENLSAELGINLYVKRDDMCGVALGGNKVRKLEYLLADAKKQGYDLVMTTGQAQSNHAMLTAACCRKTGLECILVLKKRGITERKGNQILNYLMDTEVIFVDTDDYEEIYREMDRIAEERGKKVYKIPCGGSNGLGSLGYADAVREISAQMAAMEEGKIDYLACACGSGGTAAGTAVGAMLYLPDTKVLCPMVDSDPFEEIVPAIMKDTLNLLGEEKEPVVPYLFEAWGSGYSIPSEEGNDAIRRMMQKEGILLDTCYTGKAFGGILRLAKEGYFRKGETIVFIHTGGAGGLFSQNWEEMTV